MRIAPKIFVAALSFGLAGAAFAVGDLPPQQTSGSVSYVTGGVGLDESDAIKAAEKDFSLSLLFAQTKRGEYLCDVKVSIKDKAGKTVLEAMADGPMLIARLPAGAYKISAEHEGVVLLRTVTINAKGVTRAAFVWQPTVAGTME